MKLGLKINQPPYSVPFFFCFIVVSKLGLLKCSEDFQSSDKRRTTFVTSAATRASERAVGPYLS